MVQEMFQSNLRGMETFYTTGVYKSASLFQSNLRGMETQVTSFQLNVIKWFQSNLRGMETKHLDRHYCLSSQVSIEP